MLSAGLTEQRSQDAASLPNWLGDPGSKTKSRIVQKLRRALQEASWGLGHFVGYRSKGEPRCRTSKTNPRNKTMNKTLSAAALMTALMSSTALASEIETRTFTFQNEGATLSGTLYLPSDHDGSALPTVVVTGSWTSVEEQMPALYAAEMVERGYAAVTFDFRGWGKSGNLPASTPGGMRFIEDPSAKISDIVAAVNHIADFAEVDAVFIAGLCQLLFQMVSKTRTRPRKV